MIIDRRLVPARGSFGTEAPGAPPAAGVSDHLPVVVRSEEAPDRARTNGPRRPLLVDKVLPLG
ncbi:MAG: hypothetical protein FJ098_15780 [Deltaproteobacteria bacterium]|nr:hypothetical protein [Deltaproteobacteria bacterium]